MFNTKNYYNLITLLTLLITFSSLQAADPGIDFFESKIRPVLVKHCYECHSAKSKTIEGAFLLDTQEGMLQGGDSGSSFIAKKPEESLIISSIKYQDFEMPPKSKLPKSVIADFEKWIKMGAPDPRKGKSPVVRTKLDLEEARKFWLYQNPHNISPPQVKQTTEIRNEIDHFILAKLEKSGLNFNHLADKQTLLRRVYFDLVGLPPTLSQIEEYMEDDSEAALANVVDKLLSSPHFGERWGRHWLDVVRFAESTGGGRTKVLKDAWKFRDYVIKSFNDDKPYDLFVREHIAGDLLPFDTNDQRAEQLTAVGFLALGPTNYELQDKELLRMEVVDEQLDTIGRTFLGLTIGCARCHDHKFDAIPHSDYYALAGIFKSTKTLTPGNVAGFVMRDLPLDEKTKSAREKYQVQVTELESQIKANKAQVTKLQKRIKPDITMPISSEDGLVVDDIDAKKVGDWKNSVHDKNYVGKGYIHDQAKDKGKASVQFTPEFPAPGEYEVRIAYTASSNRAPNALVIVESADGKKEIRVDQRVRPLINKKYKSLGTFKFEANGKESVTISNKGTKAHVIADAVAFVALKKSEPKLVDKPEDSATELAAKKEIQKSNAAIKAEIKVLDDQKKGLEKLLAAVKKKMPAAVAVMGVMEEPNPDDCKIHIRGNVHNLGYEVPRGFLSVIPTKEALELGEKESGRSQLAEWITEPDHPITARVMVNRIWLHLLGEGIVRTPDNFGTMGNLPTHQGLLDYLAIRFRNDGWSIKRMIKFIILSRTYQQSSLTAPEVLTSDPENFLFSRAFRRRLEAEAIRDSFLSASGELDKTFFGSTVSKIGSELGYTHNSIRRSIYVPAFRNAINDLFTVFDVANPNLVHGKRNTSVLPTQGLYLMNSPFVFKRAEAAAKRHLTETQKISRMERIQLAYLKTLNRSATDQEGKIILDFLNNKFGEDIPNVTDQQSAWTSVFQSLFSSIDFRYIY